jgi:hypothetical protein
MPSYRISLHKMIAWCKKTLPFNKFASDLWLNKALLAPETLMLLNDFDLESAILEFIHHLENKGFLKNYFLDFYLVENDMLTIDEVDTDEIDISEDILQFTGISKADFNLLSPDEQEMFLERARIMEFDGGLSKIEAEEKAYRPFLAKTQDLLREI